METEVGMPTLTVDLSDQNGGFFGFGIEKNIIIMNMPSNIQHELARDAQCVWMNAQEP